jgi:hypothetical protein
METPASPLFIPSEAEGSAVFLITHRIVISTEVLMGLQPTQEDETGADER